MQDVKVFESAHDPTRLAREFFSTFPLPLRFWRERWWIYTGTHWAPFDLTDLRVKLTQHVKEAFDAEAVKLAEMGISKPARHVTATLIGNVLGQLIAFAAVSSDTDQPCWLDGGSRSAGRIIPLENGLLDVDSHMLLPHDPAYFSSNCLPYAYDPDADCPRFYRFLDEIFEGDDQRIMLIRELLGYLLVHDTSQQVFFAFTGEGSNGKSALLSVITHLLGVQNVSHVQLELFGQRFQLIETLGKLANIATEVGEIGQIAEGVLKSFTSGDRMSFESKGKQPISAMPTARLIFSCNKLPQFKDRSSGTYRRMMVVPFGVQIPKHKQDKQIVQKLTSELPGILNWALAGLRTLQARGYFVEPQVTREAAEAYKEDVNPAKEFLIDEIRANREGAIVCALLYGEYVEWCKVKGHRPLDDRNFGKEIRRAFPNVLRVRQTIGRKRVWMYLGIEGIPVEDSEVDQSAAMPESVH